MLDKNLRNNDHLGYEVYAEALANYIENVETPHTIGLYARTGSGKSFLLDKIQSMLTRLPIVQTF